MRLKKINVLTQYLAHKCCIKVKITIIIQRLINKEYMGEEKL